MAVRPCCRSRGGSSLPSELLGAPITVNPQSREVLDGNGARGPRAVRSADGRARRAGIGMTKLEGTMAEISISACRTALQWAWCRRQAGIPLKVQGRQVVIDRPVEARGKNWVCGDLELGRAEKVALTKEARRIIAEKVTPQPPWAFPPEISSRECVKAIEHAGGVTIRHRGEELHITEIVTRGTHWWSGDMRLTPGAKRRLTNAAREILKFRHSWRALRG